MSKAAKPSAPQEASAPPPKKSRKKLFMIIAIVVALLGGGAAYFFLKPHAPANHDPLTEGEGAEAETDEKTVSTTIDMGEFVTNLVYEDADRYLKTKISLEISKPELEIKIKAKEAQIKDVIITLLSSKRASELNSPVNKEKLKNEIKSHIEFVLGLRKKAPTIQTDQSDSQPEQAALPPPKDIAPMQANPHDAVAQSAMNTSSSPAKTVMNAASSPAKTVAAAEHTQAQDDTHTTAEKPAKKGLIRVFFTDFLIQ